MIVAPANTPNAIVNKLHSALKGILELPEIQQQLINLGMIPISSPAPEELQRFSYLVAAVRQNLSCRIVN
jgi:tripartite-type tricarboxylate transporter receptor subunit TctC